MSAPTIVQIAPGIAFEPGAAAAFRRLTARLGRTPDVNSSFRDYVKQLSMFRAWEDWVAGRGPKPSHSRAIDPDLSKHCMGLAFDSDDWTTPGFITLAAEYGFIRTAANDPTERHHFEYQWWRDQHRNDPVPSGAGSAVPTPLEDDDMIGIEIDAGASGKHRCILGSGRFRHLLPTDDPEWILKVTSVEDRWVPVPIGKLPALLRSYGCDLHIWDFRGGQFVVFDPLDGSVRSGNVWTDVNAARSAVAQVQLTSQETADYLAGLEGDRAKAEAAAQ